jgi:hypothetical protein
LGAAPRVLPPVTCRNISGTRRPAVPSGARPHRARRFRRRNISGTRLRCRAAVLSRSDAVDRGEHAARVLSSPTRRRPSGCVARNTVWFFQSVSPDVFGGTPNTAGQRPALPIPTASFRLRVCCEKCAQRN